MNQNKFFAKLESGTIGNVYHEIEASNKFNSGNPIFSLTKEQLDAINVVEVALPDYPIDGNSYCIGQAYEENGIWKANWEIKQNFLKAKDILSAKCREDRDNLLKQSDWTQISDAPVDKFAWAEYRQALRDITSQEKFPFVIVWPVPPNSKS